MTTFLLDSCKMPDSTVSYAGSKWKVTDVNVKNSSSSQTGASKALTQEMLAETVLMLMPQNQYSLKIGNVSESGLWQKEADKPSMLTATSGRSWKVSNFAGNSMTLESKNEKGVITLSFSRVK